MEKPDPAYVAQAVRDAALRALGVESDSGGQTEEYWRFRIADQLERPTEWTTVCEGRNKRAMRPARLFGSNYWPDLSLEGNDWTVPIELKSVRAKKYTGASIQSVVGQCVAHAARVDGPSAPRDVIASVGLVLDFGGPRDLFGSARQDWKQEAQAATAAETVDAVLARLKRVGVWLIYVDVARLRASGPSDVPHLGWHEEFGGTDEE